VFALIIINKAGGLIYNKTFFEGGINQLNTNDYLVLAGTFHG
jgi:trafficking protein particle complex subunit 4